MRGKTRRQEIVGEHRREQIRVIALIGATLVLVISLCISCGKSCGCGEDSATGSAADNLGTSAARLVITDEDIRFLSSLTEYPRLVSVESPLPVGYAPSSLMTLHGMPYGHENKLHPDAGNAYFELHAAILADGYALHPLSGYRTYDEQVAIYNYNVQLHMDAGMTAEEAQARTEETIAIPGSSEHQYGRSIDVSIDDTTNHQFHKTEQGQWLIEHAHEYGFIIRYPADKVDITGINYEPWHLRWVGVEHATFIQEHGICLEEYIQLVQQHNPGAVMCDD